MAFGLPVADVIKALRTATVRRTDTGSVETVLLAIQDDWEMVAHTRFPALGSDTGDAVQAAFAKLLAPGALDALEEPSRVRAWIRTVFVHTAIDVLRERERRGQDSGGDAYEGLPASTPEPDAALRGSELTRLIEQSGDGAAAARMRWVEDLPESEIAARLGTTRSAVAARLKRLRRRLRAILDT
jgi:RNA polymerase sigma factor (sigma-70 family)